MPLNVQLVNAQVKDPQSGQMTPAGLIGSDAISTINTAKNQAIAAVQQKGEETLQSIPDDYTALSNEVDDVKTQLNETDNGYLIYTLITGEYFDGTGNVQSENSWSRTDYINVEGLTKLKVFAEYSFNNNLTFDASYQKLSLFSISAGENIITLPPNTKYIGFSGATTRIGNGFHIENVADAKKLDPVATKCENNREVLDYLQNTFNATIMPVGANVGNFYISTAGLFLAAPIYKTERYDIEFYDKIYIINETAMPVKYQFQSAANTPISGTNSYLIGDPVTTAINGFVDVPNGAKYIFVAKPVNDTVSGVYKTPNEPDKTLTTTGIPADAKAVGERFDDIVKLIESANLFTANVKIENPNAYIVGTGQTYTTISSAIAQWIADNKPSAIIKILSGIYEESIDLNSLIDNNRLYIIGEDIDTVMIKQTDASYDHPPMNVTGNVTIKNISFIVDKTSAWTQAAGAYAIHIDSPTGRGEVILENVYAESTLNAAIGCGTSANQSIILKNVELEHTAEVAWATATGVNNGGLLYHTSATPSSPNQKLYLDNVKAHSKYGPGIQILSSANGDTDVSATFRFCIAHADYYEAQTSQTTKEQKVVISNANGKIVISEDSMCNNSYKLNYNA